MECPFCKKANLDSGFIMGNSRTYFFSDEDKGKLLKNPIRIKAYLCNDCGMVFLIKEKS
jgi:uncharacterized protein YlaI